MPSVLTSSRRRGRQRGHTPPPLLSLSYCFVFVLTMLLFVLFCTTWAFTTTITSTTRTTKAADGGILPTNSNSRGNGVHGNHNSIRWDRHRHQPPSASSSNVYLLFKETTDKNNNYVEDDENAISMPSSVLSKTTNIKTNENSIDNTNNIIQRRSILQKSVQSFATLTTSLFLLSSSSSSSSSKQTFKIAAANAAPPIAIIAEELGYFPITDKNGHTMYVPARVKRASTQQAVSLAKHLSSIGAVMYGAYWCPHCSRQKEMFGREAWSYIQYVECSTQGYKANVSMCMQQHIDGYPIWKIPKTGQVLGSGEMTLDALARVSKFPGVLDTTLEMNVPPSPLGSTNGCR